MEQLAELIDSYQRQLECYRDMLILAQQQRQLCKEESFHGPQAMNSLNNLLSQRQALMEKLELEKEVLKETQASLCRALNLAELNLSAIKASLTGLGLEQEANRELAQLDELLAELGLTLKAINQLDMESQALMNQLLAAAPKEVPKRPVEQVVHSAKNAYKKPVIPADKGNIDQRR